MSNIWDRVSKGSQELTKDAASSAPKSGGVATTNYVWCSAFVEGADKCKCPKHGGKPKEEVKNGIEEQREG